MGLNLCPFAKSPLQKGRIAIDMSDAKNEAELMTDLAAALLRLNETPMEEIETSLLIHPYVLTEFFEYNKFLKKADRCIRSLDLEGVIQIASFHPAYEFSGSASDDTTNNSNRSPYPMLHLLRESSIDAAVASGQSAAAIIERNQQTLTSLGNLNYAKLLEES